MFTRLTGTLDALTGNQATITPEGLPGLALEVLLPGYLAARLAIDENAPAGPRRITLCTLAYLESQGQGSSFIPRMLGFASPGEREFFELFTTVKGLGNKRGLRAMAREPGVIAQAIAARNTRLLQELPEIGKRLAETVVAELSGKVDRFAALLAPAGATRVTEVKVLGPGDEAVRALIALGETRGEAERLVSSALGRDPDLAGTDRILQAALLSR